MLALELKQLRKTYANGVEALKGISLSVEKGSFIGLLGPNGAGKSTIISIINSLTRKTSGDVTINGHNIDYALSAAKAQIGVVPQEFNFNIFEKIQQIVINQAGYYGIPYREAAIRAKKYLSMLELWGQHNHIARILSGGMKRRLMIARALVHEPEVLILDEPTAGVDVEIRRSMWDLLQQLNSRGKTIILTTHYLEEAETLCDRIAIIHQGNLIQDTTKKQLLALLDVETFVLDLAEPLRMTLPILDGFKFKQTDPMTLEAECSKKKKLNELFSFLNEHNILVCSMRNRSNRLEELFLRLTR